METILESGAPLSSVSRELMLDILDHLIDPDRSDTQEDSKAHWVQLLEKTGYHFLNDKPVPTVLKFARYVLVAE